MSSPHGTRVVNVGEAAFNPFSSVPHQASAPSSLDSPSVGVSHLLLARPFLPVAPTTLRFGNIGSKATLGLRNQHRATVVPPIRDQILERGLAHLLCRGFVVRHHR